MKNKAKKELAVCGFEAVLALSRIHPEKITRLYFSENRIHSFGGACKFLAQHKIPYNTVQDTELEKLCGSVHHQGAVAMIAQPEIEPLTSEITDDWLHKKQGALLLDRIGNANNFGAIVRSAAFFGMKNIIIPLTEEQTSITTSAYRIAQGGMELVNIYSVMSILKLLEALKGKMFRLGSDVGAKTHISQIHALCKAKPALIVLGNEENGISREVKENCDALVVIPSAGMFTDPDKAAPVESLNVAQAASVILYEWAKGNA
ncbi:RNA methyltransferase [Treponema parvum]|uniref:RNA methyltransferase n=1 Tax=Treponema parvum TaxID=138851 RepID=A0A975IDE4_9SPIR|nr:RNA methyltransferase [Treponema parvum]QTQ12703.1 RNA methyltransferase [Treponema parvum]